MQVLRAMPERGMCGIVTGPMLTGMVMNIGRTGAYVNGEAQLVIGERRVELVDTGAFTQCGIEPQRTRYMLIGWRQHLRNGFEPIARHILPVLGPGACRSEVRDFWYRRLHWPMYRLATDAHSAPAP